MRHNRLEGYLHPLAHPRILTPSEFQNSGLGALREFILLNNQLVPVWITLSCNGVVSSCVQPILEGVMFVSHNQRVLGVPRGRQAVSWMKCHLCSLGVREDRVKPSAEGN